MALTGQIVAVNLGLKVVKCGQDWSSDANMAKYDILVKAEPKAKPRPDVPML